MTSTKVFVHESTIEISDRVDEGLLNIEVSMGESPESDRCLAQCDEEQTELLLATLTMYHTRLVQARMRKAAP